MTPLIVPISLRLLTSPVAQATVRAAGGGFAGARGLVVFAVARGQLVAAQVSAAFGSLAALLGTSGFNTSTFGVVGDNFVAFAQNVTDRVLNAISPEDQARLTDLAGRRAKSSEMAERAARRAEEIADRVDDLRDAIDDLEDAALENAQTALERSAELLERARNFRDKLNEAARQANDAFQREFDRLFPPSSE